MNKKKKSGPVGTIIFIVLLAAVIIGIYLKITGDKDEGTKEIPTEISETETLIKRNLEKNYPGTPREVLRFFCRIAECLYNEDLSDDQIKKLIQQLRAIYTDELRDNNTEEEMISSVKYDRAEYKKDKKEIFGYWIQNSEDIEYVETKFGDTAIIKMSFTNKISGSGVKKVYEVFSLVKDSDGRWKIAAFEELKNQATIDEIN